MNNSIKMDYSLSDFDNEKFIKVRLRICHDGVNLNGSRFSLEAMRNAMESVKNIPILAHICYTEDGKPIIGSHDTDIEKNRLDNSNLKMIYEEIPIGVVPESCNYSIDLFDDKYYACCDAYIWRNYSNYAEDIIEKSQTVGLSMEISVDDMNCDSQGVFDIYKYRYTGITLLGDDVTPAMCGANATVVFSENNNIKDKMCEMMKELKEVLEKFSAENFKEGGRETMDNVVVENINEVIVVETSEEFEAPVENTMENATAVEETVVEEKFEEEVKAEETVSENVENTFEENVEPTEINLDEVPFVEVNRDEYSSMTEELSVLRSMKEEYENLKAEYEAIANEINSLREFKMDVEAEQLKVAKGKVFEKWNEILKDNAEYSSLLNEMDSYSIDEIEVKCKCIYADLMISNMANLSANTQFSAKNVTKKSEVKISVTEENVNEKPLAYGGLVESFR